MANALYISYDGLMEPLGRSQIVPYLVEIAKRSVSIEVLSFEKTTDLANGDQINQVEKELASADIRWTRLPYHNRPKVGSTVFDILVGSWKALRIARAGRVRLVHARSYVPACMSLPVKFFVGAKFLFDMRGFWPEERVELGIFSPGGILFRSAKWLESIFVRNADQIVVLTNRARKIMLEDSRLTAGSDQIEVIPCCVDLRRFLPEGNGIELVERFGLVGKVVVGNIGAVNNRYLVKDIFRFYAALKKFKKELRFVFITRQEPAEVYRLAKEQGIEPTDLVVTSATPDEIPTWLRLFQLGIFFLRPTYAAQASSFTKLGEFLAAGVPVVTNTGVGDVEETLDQKNVALLLQDFSDDEIQNKAAEAARMLPPSEEMRRSCRNVAEKRLGLGIAGSRYLSVYANLLKGQKLTGGKHSDGKTAGGSLERCVASREHSN